LDLTVHSSNDPHQLAPSGANIVELFFEESMSFRQFVELLESERVDRPEQTQFALEFALTGRGGDTLGKFRSWRRDRNVGFDIEIASHRLDRRFETKANLGTVEFDPSGPFPGRFEFALGPRAFGAGRVESPGQSPSLIALATTLFHQVLMATFDGTPPVLEAFGDLMELEQGGFDSFASLRGFGSGSHIGGQAVLGFGTAPFEQLTPFDQTGGADL